MYTRYVKSADYESILPIYKEVHELHAKALPDIFNINENPLPIAYYNYLIKNSHFVLIENDHEIIGIAVLKIKESSDINILVKRKFAVLEDLAILSKYRHQGYGKLIFSRCLEIAKENHVDSIELNVWEFNQNAIKFYEHLNMKTLNRKMTLQLYEERYL